MNQQSKISDLSSHSIFSQQLEYQKTDFMMIFLSACSSACCRTYSHIIFSIQNNVIIHYMIYKAKNRLSTTSCLSICFKQLAELIQQALHVLLLLTDLLHNCLLINFLHLCYMSDLLDNFKSQQIELQLAAAVCSSLTVSLSIQSINKRSVLQIYCSLMSESFHNLDSTAHLIS